MNFFTVHLFCSYSITLGKENKKGTTGENFAIVHRAAKCIAEIRRLDSREICGIAKTF